MNVYLKAALGIGFDIVFIPWLIFTLAGDWRWTEGWIFVALFFGMIVASMIPLLKNKKLLKELKEYKAYKKKVKNRLIPFVI